MLGNYFDKCYDFSDAERKKRYTKYNPAKVSAEVSAYTSLKGNKKEKCPNIPNRLPLESDEKVKEVTGSKILTPKKLLTRLPGLLAQVKVGQYSYKLKSKIR